MRQEFIDECKVIKQNAEYTAETHHQMATVQKNKAFWLQVVPSVCAAVTGTLVAAGYAKEDLLFITIISAVVSAVANVINPNKIYQEHLSAAKSFTIVKHDARFLCQASGSTMSDELFFAAVNNLHNKYNDLIGNTPATSGKAFGRAQTIIQKGTHEPDRDQNGNIK